MVQRDLKTVAKAALIVSMTAAFIRFDLPVGQAVTTIIVGRTLLGIVFGAFLFSGDFSFSEARPFQLLPQTQLVLWGVGLLAIILATDGLRWLEPTVNFWIGTAIVLTIGSHAGFLWVWRQLVRKLMGGNAR